MKYDGACLQSGSGLEQCLGLGTLGTVHSLAPWHLNHAAALPSSACLSLCWSLQMRPLLLLLHPGGFTLRPWHCLHASRPPPPPHRPADSRAQHRPLVSARGMAVAQVRRQGGPGG